MRMDDSTNLAEILKMNTGLRWNRSADVRALVGIRVLCMTGWCKTATKCHRAGEPSDFGAPLAVSQACILVPMVLALVLTAGQCRSPTLHQNTTHLFVRRRSFCRVLCDTDRIRRSTRNARPSERLSSVELCRLWTHCGGSTLTCSIPRLHYGVHKQNAVLPRHLDSLAMRFLTKLSQQSTLM